MVSELLGGTGLFLLGVFLMTDGLKTAAGDTLRRMLVRFTGRPATAFVSGACITVLAQSSSATTLATIGFVSAGILTFSQAIGIVIGASLGTTSTGWLVSLVGLKFGIGKLAFPLVGLGAMARLVSHGRNAAMALAVAGFGLMFVGIDILQTGTVHLSASFSPDQLPHGTLLGRCLLVGIGIVLTILTQSSAAAVAMTLAAFHSGMIDLEQGTSLIIGASIGTTSTSALAAIGATTSARRTALAHVLFSVGAGVLAFLLVPLFVYGVRQAGQTLELQFGVVILAAFHSGFTLLAGLIFLPVVKDFSKLVEGLVPERGPILTRHLDASLVEVPEIAIEAVRRTLLEVYADILEAIERAIHDGIASTPERMDAALAALRETRRFLGTVAFSASRPDQYRARVAIIHAADHLHQLAVVVKDNFEPGLLIDEPRLQMPKRLVTEMIETVTAAMQRQAPTLERDQLKRISLALAEFRRTGRAGLLKESAHGTVEAGPALQALNGLRWLDAVGYHAWRAAHHLGAEAHEAADDSDDARHQAEFRGD
ncbi:MAG: Na/Pi cotransporter family protein [Verrucomicrobia bacterium]|nr:Na/Pi cotransporter family protein [Verrucomicrobiota bacterium]